MRDLRGERLVVATHNQGKLSEISELLLPFGVEVLSAADLGLEEPEETEDSFIGNARIKAHAAARATQLPALADDSGICVDALGGAPGVRTADWAETPTGRNFTIAMQRTHAKLERSGASRPWHAQFRCTLVIAWPDGVDAVFEGIMHGQVIWPRRGVEGHGYDPIFQPDGYTATFAEISMEVKNRISHRSDAFRKLVTRCFT